MNMEREKAKRRTTDSFMQLENGVFHQRYRGGDNNHQTAPERYHTTQ
jgi:hypothetical protein